MRLFYGVAFPLIWLIRSGTRLFSRLFGLGHTGEAEAFSEDELRAQTTEPLPDREVMSTLLLAPLPGTIPPPALIDGDSS